MEAHHKHQHISHKLMRVILTEFIISQPISQPAREFTAINRKCTDKTFKKFKKEQ